RGAGPAVGRVGAPGGAGPVVRAGHVTALGSLAVPGERAQRRAGFQRLLAGRGAARRAEAVPLDLLAEPAVGVPVELTRVPAAHVVVSVGRRRPVAGSRHPI